MRGVDFTPEKAAKSKCSAAIRRPTLTVIMSDSMLTQSLEQGARIGTGGCFVRQPVISSFPILFLIFQTDLSLAAALTIQRSAGSQRWAMARLCFPTIRLIILGSTEGTRHI